MKIVTPYARIDRLNGETIPIITNAGIEALRVIEYYGRISHRSEDAQTEESWKRFIPAVVISKGDWSIVEHVSATVEFTVDRGITHEIVRHRLFSFTQESTRFVNYEKKMPASFIEPYGLTDSVERAGNGEAVELSTKQMWDHAIQTCEWIYKQLVGKGVAPQIARSILPNGLAAKIIMTGNLRNWRHFLLMRTTVESHPQMREVTIPLLAEFKSAVPLLFDDIEPGARQVDNLKKAR